MDAGGDDTCRRCLARRRTSAARRASRQHPREWRWMDRAAGPRAGRRRLRRTGGAARRSVSSLARPTTQILAGGVTDAAHVEVPLIGMTDGALVRRTLDGDARAFTELVDRHAAACLRFAARMLGDRSEAEDVAQE